MPARLQSALAIAGGVVMLVLAIYGVRLYFAKANAEQSVAVASEPAAVTAAPLATSPPAAAAAVALTGAAVDLSTVMGRARKLANVWQAEAALLGIEATLANGKIQTLDGATAKLTFGPSPFDAKARSGLFVVVYDKSGISGAPTPGTPGKTLPEPMCAPEAVLLRMTDLGVSAVALRYAADAEQRPMWLATAAEHPSDPPRLFDPQDCHLRGVTAWRTPH